MPSAASSPDAGAARNTNRPVNVARVLLTYPQCGEEKDGLVEFLGTIPDCQCCVVGRENHHATEGLHLHAFLRLGRARKVRANTLNAMFNWQVGERIYHPNSELVKNSKADMARVVGYVTKDGDYTSDSCDADAVISAAHRKKYNTRRIPEADIPTPVENSEATRGIWVCGRSGTGPSGPTTGAPS